MSGENVTDRNLYGKYFKLSGFTERDVHDIACHTKKAKQAAKEQKARRRAERQAVNNRKSSPSPTLQVLIKARKHMTYSKKKTQFQKTTEQIRYGYDIAAWMGLQHG